MMATLNAEVPVQQQHQVMTLLVETPRGRTAATTVPINLPYESLVDRVWDAAVARDAQEEGGGGGGGGEEEEEEEEGNDGIHHHCNPNNNKRVATSDLIPTSRRRRRRLNSYIVHNGHVIEKDNYQSLLLSNKSAQKTATTTSSSASNHASYFRNKRVSLRLRLLGGIDRQNRVGSKFGGGGVSSAQNAERERKERLKRLALESIDLAKDPYLMRNHLGTYECKLCLTIHPNEANYLSHTQGKKHQQGLAKRAYLEKLKAEQDASLQSTFLQQQQQASQQKKPVLRKVRIGRPAYQVLKSRDVDTNQRCLSFELSFPEIQVGLQPRHRFMSAFEQRVDTPPDRRYQYLLVAAEPYETVAFKIPNEPIDKGEGRFVTHWDAQHKKFTLTLNYLNPEDDTNKKESGGGGEESGPSVAAAGKRQRTG